MVAVDRPEVFAVFSDDSDAIKVRQEELNNELEAQWLELTSGCCGQVNGFPTSLHSDMQNHDESCRLIGILDILMYNYSLLDILCNVHVCAAHICMYING